MQALDESRPFFTNAAISLTKLVDLAKSRLDAGEGTRGDVTVLEAQRVELDVELATTEMERRDERLRLARLIGEPSSAATWTLDRWTAPETIVPSESAWVESALQRRPEIQSIAWQMAALGDDLALTRLLPWEGASVGAQAERDGNWSMGLRLLCQCPFFDMGQARAARVTAEQIEARHEMTRTKRLVVEEVRRAYESLARTEANLRRVREELIPLQQQRSEQAQASFRAGQSDVTALFLAEQDLRSAEARAVDLERQTTIALVRLHRAVGGAGVAMKMRDGPSTRPESSTNPHVVPNVNSAPESLRPSQEMH